MGRPGSRTPRWQLAVLAVWLLASAAALAVALTWPAGAAQELTVEGVKADAFPRVAVRFRIEPDVGTPPAQLDVSDVVITEGTARLSPLEVYAVGNAPTERVGTYEAVWMSTASVAPGDSIAGRISIAQWRRGDFEGELRFTRPLPKVAQNTMPAVTRADLPVVPQPDTSPLDISLVGAVAGVLAGLGVLLVAPALLWRAKMRLRQERLAIWVAGSAPVRMQVAGREKSVSRRQQPVSPLIIRLGKIGARFLSTSQTEKMRRKLVLAGRGSAQEYTQFVAKKVSLGLVLMAVGAWVMLGRAPFLNAILLAGCMGLLGFILPNIQLGRQVKRRQYNLRKSLPDALDLMTIGVGAGLAFDGAIAEIVGKWSDDLSREFTLLLGELRMGTGRRDALLNLADRTEVEEIQTMVSQLVQAEELGMGLAETLTTLSNQMRQRRRQRAEEQAQKAAVKMLIPLVFLIFPALFIVILGPAIQDIFTFLEAGPK